MENKQKIVEFKGVQYRLTIPTVGSKIRTQAIIQQQTRGMQVFLSGSYNDEAVEAANLAVTLAKLQTNVERLKKDSQEADYDLDFFALDDSIETAELIQFLAKELEDFVNSFRKETKA